MSKKPVRPTPSNPNIVAVYARVSSREQAQKQTIQTQLEECRRYCQQHNLTIAGEYLDEGVSGSIEFDSRAGGKALLVAADRGEFGLVLFWDTSRLGREDVVSHLARYALEKKGIDIKSVSEPFDTGSPDGVFMFGILSAGAAYQRKRIMANSKAGLRRIAKDGRWATGPVPYGCQLTRDRRLEPHPQESEIIRRIFRDVASGKTASQVARELQAEGARRRQGHAWDVTQVSRIVRSPTYSGVHKWGDIETPLPAIVDRDTQEKAKAALKRNKVFYSGKPGRVYALRSIVKCGFCQRSMSGITVKSGTSGRALSYYRCTAKAIDRSPCPGSYVPASELENLVLGQVRRMVAGKDLTDDIRAALKLGADRRESLERYREEQRTKLSDAEDSIARNQEQLVRGRLTEAAYDRLYATLKAESAMAQERLEAVEKELKFIPPHDAEKTIRLHMGRAQRVLRENANISPEMKQEIFRAFVTGVTVKIGKGERLQRIAQGKVDVQLLLASAGTDLDKILPLIQKESPYMPGVEQVWIELGLNVHTYDPNGDDGWESEDDRISHQDHGKPLR